MSTMTAALYDGTSRMDVVEIEKPAPGPGDVILRVRCTGICGSDLLMNLDKTEPDRFPAGHEVAGEVVDVGDGVDASLVGQRVAVDTLGGGLGCMDCWYCRMGQFQMCDGKRSSEGGGFAQYMKRRAFGCYRLPDSLTWEEGGLVEPLAVSVHGVRRGQMSGGETVAVLGAGNIGLTAVAAARALGAGTVLASARHPQQAAMARSLGADEALPSEGRAFQDAVEEATEGRGADLTIETVGGKQAATLEQAVDVTRKQGRVVVLGGFRKPIALDWMGPLQKEQSIVFANCYSVLEGRHDYELAIELMASGRAPVEQMVTHRYPLERIQNGFDTAYDKATGSIKVQIHQAGE